RAGAWWSRAAAATTPTAPCRAPGRTPGPRSPAASCPLRCPRGGAPRGTRAWAPRPPRCRAPPARTPTTSHPRRTATPSRVATVTSRSARWLPCRSSGARPGSSGPTDRRREMRIGFIGLGTMGAPMARRLVEAGHDVTVHNRTREREEPLAALGAKRAASPRACAEGAELVVTMVSDTPDVQAVVLGEQGAALGMERGSVLVDMSTIAPATTRRIAAALAEHGVAMLDAPVS